MAGFAAQARKELRQAYRPAMKVLSRNERRVKAMDAKMKRDERAYASWLKDTNASLNAEATKRDSELATAQQGFNQQLTGALDAANAASGERSAAVGGLGSAGQTPLVSTAQNVARAQSAAYGGRLSEQQQRGLGLSASVEKNSYATLGVQRAQRLVATLEALAKIAEQRGDLAMERSVKVAQRTAELEAAAAEAAAEQAKMAYDQQQDAIANDLAAARIDATLRGQDLSSADRAAQRRLTNRNARRRLAAGGGSRGRAPLRFTPGQLSDRRGKFDTLVNFGRARLRRKDFAGRKGGAKFRPGDVDKLANFIANANPGTPYEVAKIAAYVVTGNRPSTRAQAILKKHGITGV